MNDFAITIDMDWCSEEEIRSVAGQLIERNVKATWFITHDSLETRRLFKYPELFEIGIHPNFYSNSTQGKNEVEIMNYLLNIVPKAKTIKSHACKIMYSVFKKMRFIALDSFEGLPKPQNIDMIEGYSSGFFEGQFSCSEEEFLENLKENNIDLKRVVTVKGWFDQTLIEETAKQYSINKIAAAWVDCDLYESTVPVLNFLTSRLSVESVILFNDWHCFRNLPEYGEQRACREWLVLNPQIKLYDLFSFGSHGEAFTVDITHPNIINLGYNIQ